MNAQEKASWLSRNNPYKQQFMWDAFREGARAFWAGQGVQLNNYNTREKAAFWKGYDMAEKADPHN